MGIEQLTYSPEMPSNSPFVLDTNGYTKVEAAIYLLQGMEPSEGYYGAFSGGKDSVVIKDLAKQAGVKVDWHYCVSPIDPPQIYQFIRQYHPDVQWDYHAKGFWQLVVKKGLPMRTSRWCCQVIKEAGGQGRTVIVGNRRAESTKRSHQKCYELANPNKKYHKNFVRPIIGWSSAEVWQYIKANNLSYCSLYDEGFERIGCILCPFSRQIELETRYFPKTVALWKRACERLVERDKSCNYTKRNGEPMLHKFATGQERFDWWVKRD